MAFNKIDIYNRDTGKHLKDRKLSIKELFTDPKDHKDFLTWLELLTIESEVSEKREIKLLDMIRIFAKNINKPFKKLEQKDLTEFKGRLLKDKILKENKQPYSDETKEDCTESITRFFEYQYPEKVALWKSATKPFRKWFIIKAKKKTPEILTEQEAETLYLNCGDNLQRALICVLFDAGLRAGELFNVRKEDITFPSQDFPYFRIDVKEEYSKTLGRSVGLYWKHSTEALNQYLKGLEIQAKEPIFPVRYDNIRQTLRRLGLKTLKKSIHLHQFRKSSATFYASKLNRQELCKRYGWAFSSDMVDVYIKRAGIEEEGIKEKFLDTDLSKVQKENEKIKTQVALMSEKNEGMEAVLKRLLVKDVKEIHLPGRKIINPQEMDILELSKIISDSQEKAIADFKMFKRLNP